MQNTILNTKKSQELFNEAINFIPGGVNSPVRSFKSVGSTPLFISKASGKYIYDVDGNQYVDYVNSWGPLIHGHCYPKVTAAIEGALKTGITFGAPHESEIKLAKLVIDRMPSIDKLRLVNSGTEAVMTAIRLARAYTKRNKIIKFNGCYHGHSDPVLSMSGSGVASLGIPSCEGVPKIVANDTISLPYNDLTLLEITFAKYPDEIAAVIIEPIVGNAGVILPNENYLSGISSLCSRYKSVFIFDEVMTGFRVSKGGAQEKYNIKPDLTTLGKIIGGGLPIGAVGGKAEIMNMLAPVGAVYQAGTLSGNPLAVACGIATLEELDDTSYIKLQQLTDELNVGINEVNNSLGLPYKINSTCSMFSIFFTSSDVNSYESAKKASAETYSKFFFKCLENGIYLAPSQFEACFLSLAHTSEDMKNIIKVYKSFVQNK